MDLNSSSISLDGLLKSFIGSTIDILTAKYIQFPQEVHV